MSDEMICSTGKNYNTKLITDIHDFVVPIIMIISQEKSQEFHLFLQIKGESSSTSLIIYTCAITSSYRTLYLMRP